MRYLYFLNERCVDCGACRAACAAEHKRNHRVYDPLGGLPMARKWNGSATLHHLGDGIPYPMRCIHCDDARCVEACIAGSLGRTDRVFGRWALCVGCFMCVMNCPYGAMLPLADKAIKCDHCLFTEKPACVRACPQGALLYCDAEEYAHRTRPSPWRDRTPREIPLMRARR